MSEILTNLPSFLRLDEEHSIHLLTTRLDYEVKKAGFSKAVIGLSGGIDSTLALYLSVKALGKENVIGVRMPYRTSSAHSLVDAQSVINATGIEAITIEITPQIDAYFQQWPDASPLRRGNKMARERMSTLYDLSAKYDALVIGTGNRSEILLGYGTQYGDTACAINPLGNLFKTQVYQLANFLEVPNNILCKPPSADLWENQTDERELGFSYLEVDQLFHYMLDQQYSQEQLLALSFTEEFIQNVVERMKRNEFKRKLPSIINAT